MKTTEELMQEGYVSRFCIKNEVWEGLSLRQRDDLLEVHIASKSFYKESATPDIQSLKTPEHIISFTK